MSTLYMALDYFLYMNEQKIMLSLVLAFGVFLILGLIAIPIIEKAQVALSIYAIRDPSDTITKGDRLTKLGNQLKHDEDKVTDSITNADNKILGAHGGGVGIQFCDPSGLELCNTVMLELGLMFS